MGSPLINDKKPDFQKAIDHLKEELAAMRTGRAHPALVEKVMVDAYGTMTPLKGVGSVTIPDAKTISIEPWDANLVKNVEKALVDAQLGMNPTVQGKVIRLVMPAMTEERRKELVKIVKEKSEDTRKAVRAVREKIREKVGEMEKAKQVTEDDRFKAQDELDKMAKEFSAVIEKMIEEKEKEIMTV